MDKEKILDFVSIFLEQCIGDTINEKEVSEVVKAMDEEQRRAMFVVLAPEQVDAHGDIYSADEIEKACINFNIHCMKANIMHQIDIESDKAVIEQSYITPCDFELDDGRKIVKGTWIQTWHFPDTEMWSLVKSGEINGVSVGCRAIAEELE